MSVGVMPRSAPNSKAGESLEGLSRRLCEAVASWRYEDLPDDVKRTVTLFILDTLGVIGGAGRAPGIDIVNARVARWSGGGSATGLLTSAGLSPPDAALANGAAAHALDFDDMHDPARIHAFCVAFPAMLATAEDIGGVDGRRFLLALAIAAEVHARLGFTCNNSLGKGWHPTMTLGVLAGALGAGQLLEMDANRLLSGLGLALHQACGTAQSMHDGVLSKRLGAGIAARNAVTAAFLAHDGFTGPFRPLEGESGLFRLFERDEVNPSALLDGIGETWETRGYSFKPYPCCRCNHTTIELAFGLRQQGLTPEQVERVEIWLPQVNFQAVGQPYDVNRESVVHAQFNVRYTFARALTDGRIDLASYTLAQITDQHVAELARRVTAAPDPDERTTDMGPSRIRVTKRDGQVMETSGRTVPGSPEAPMSEEQVIDKFRACLAFGRGVEGEPVDRFVELVLRLEELDDVGELPSAFRALLAGADEAPAEGHIR